MECRATTTCAGLLLVAAAEGGLLVLRHLVSHARARDAAADVTVLRRQKLGVILAQKVENERGQRRVGVAGLLRPLGHGCAASGRVDA